MAGRESGGSRFNSIGSGSFPESRGLDSAKTAQVDISSQNVTTAIALVETQDALKAALDNPDVQQVQKLEADQLKLCNDMVTMKPAAWVVLEIRGVEGHALHPVNSEYIFTVFEHGIQLQIQNGKLHVFPYTSPGSVVATVPWRLSLQRNDQSTLQTTGNSLPVLRIASFDSKEDAENFSQNPYWISDLSREKSSDRLTALAPLPPETPGITESILLLIAAIRRALGRD